MNGRSKCMLGLVFPPSRECFQFRKQKEIIWGNVWGGGGGGRGGGGEGEGGGGRGRGVREGKTVTFFFLQNAVTMRRYELGHCHVEDGYV